MSALAHNPPYPVGGACCFEAQTMMAFAPHMALFPGLAIIITVPWSEPAGRWSARCSGPSTTPGTIAMALLKISNLSLSIGNTNILDEISMVVEPGEIRGIVGESGSGKSMTAFSVHAAFAPICPASRSH